MEKTARAELIAALVTDKYSGFTDGDEPILEAASDERLERFRAASDAARSAVNEHARLETDNRNTAARLKVAEDKLKAGEAPMTEDEFILKAPTSIKGVLEAAKAAADAEHAALVSVLKECGKHSEEDLKKMKTPELQVLAQYAGVRVPDFSGKGVPAPRNAQDKTSYAPPDGYALALKAQQPQSKAVN